ncbi:MAG: hypothetical protein V3W28_07730 [Thermoplasmata archaeon]
MEARKALPYPWIMDARKALNWLIPATFVLVVGLWYANGLTDVDLSLFLNLFVAGFTALLGARIAMWIYSQLTEEGQQRLFGHELEIRYFEKIYGPLYEETKSVVDDLERYGRPWMAEWPKVKEGRFGPFVNPRIHSALEELREELEAFRSVVIGAEEAAGSVVRKVLDTKPWKTAIPQDKRGSVERGLAERWDTRAFLFDPKTALPAEHIRPTLREQISVTPQLIEEVGEKVGRAFSAAVKKSLRQDPQIDVFLGERARVLAFAEKVHNKVLQRMRDPFRQL